MTSVCGFHFGEDNSASSKLRRVHLHHDATLEIESGRKPEIFVRWPRITIDAAMLATAIRIEARFESDIRTVVARDDRFRAVAKILRLRVAVVLPSRIGSTTSVSVRST